MTSRGEQVCQLCGRRREPTAPPDVCEACHYAATEIYHYAPDR